MKTSKPTKPNPAGRTDAQCFALACGLTDMMWSRLPASSREAYASYAKKFRDLTTHIKFP